MNAEYQATTGTEPSGFICPVCLRDVDVDRVTQAHAPAEKVGGKVVTYICATCNSDMGSRYEAGGVDAVRRRRGLVAGEWTDKGRVGSGLPGRNLIGSTIKVKKSAEGAQEIHIYGPKAGTHAHTRWLEEINLIIEGRDARFEMIGPSNEVVHRAYMSWAYLALVGLLGYRFATSPPARLVANALLASGRELFGASAVVQIDAVENDLSFEPSYPVGLITAESTGSPDAFGWRYGPVICIFPLRTDRAGQIYQLLERVEKATGRWYRADPEGLLRHLAPQAID
jgi:hypothetical protein